MYSEKEIEKLLTTEMEKIGGRSYKWESPGNAGVPDRIVVFPNGRIRFVELKTRKGRLSDLQKVQIKRLQALNQAVYVTRGIQGLIDFFKAEGEYGTALDLGKRLERDRT